MDAWPMVEACWWAQWRGFTFEEQAYMIQESDHGHPTYIVLGHHQFNIWSVEYCPSLSVNRRDVAGDQLMSVKIDSWPGEMSP